MSATHRDYFDTARVWAAMGMVLAAALLIFGSFLDWITVERLPEIIPADQASRAAPFTGAELGDGYVTCVAGIAIAACAALLIVKMKSSYAWLGFVAAIVGGGVAISHYRGIDQVFEDIQGIGAGVSPGVGLTMVAAGALVGMIASVAGVAATPNKA